jgi:hypothetical protein
MAIGAGSQIQEASAPRGKAYASVDVKLFWLHFCVFVCMYLSQAVLWPTYLGIASDFFQHAQHA